MKWKRIAEKNERNSREINDNFLKEKNGVRSRNLDGYIWKKGSKGKEGCPDNCLQRHMLGIRRKQNCYIIIGDYS